MAGEDVLATHFPYVKSLFASGMFESTTNCVFVDDIDAPAFKEVLKFIYCDDFLENIDASAEVYLPIADRYGLLELKERSTSALGQGITIENVIERVILPHLKQFPSLKNRCLRYLKALPDPAQALSAEALEPLKAYPDLLVDHMRCKPS